jgi:hypothetical protein
LGFIFIASILLFVSVFWQHIGSASSASMARNLAYGTVNGRVGGTAMACGWASVLLCFVVATGLLIMILAVRVLTELAD